MGAHKPPDLDAVMGSKQFKRIVSRAVVINYIAVDQGS
jgi:hypothetical protein